MNNTICKTVPSPLGILPAKLFHFNVLNSPSTQLPQDFKALQENCKNDDLILRYQLQSNMRSTLQSIPAFSNALKCLRTRIIPKVSINQSSTGKTFYGGLKICGLKWLCPCCAHKIQQQRRIEIAKTFTYAYSNSYKIIMVTFTFPHKDTDKLQDLLTKQALAFKYLRRGRSFNDFKKEHGFQGMIRSLEITHGDSGFHPHTHEAWIVDKDADVYTIHTWVLNAWTKACQDAKLIPKRMDKDKKKDFNERSVHVLDNCQSSKYLSKQSDVDSWSNDERQRWGIDKELACASTKQGRKSGKTPFQLLEENSSKSRTIFIEYARATKGKHQLLWSPGLKATVGIEDRKDTELTEIDKEEDKYSSLALLDSKQWDIILRKKARALILIIAETQGFNGLQAWFASHNNSLTAPTKLDIIHNNCLTQHIRQRKTTSIDKHYDLIQANDLQKEKWLEMSLHLTSNQPIPKQNILLQT